MAALPWNQWQLSRGMGGRLRLESVATLVWNTQARFTACGLTLHPRKTKIVYCKSEYNRRDYPEIAFDFLGYTFRPRLIRNRLGQKKVYFTAAISQSAAKEIRKQINEIKSS